MPWCDHCDRYLTPNALTDEGGCPTCGEKADVGAGEVRTQHDAAERVPWHFWLVVAALAVYLGWRLIQGIAWFF